MDMGEYAANTIKAFSEIGGPQKAALLATVMASFPGSKYPQSTKEYDDRGELEGAREFLNGDFDDKYYHSSEKIEELMVAYVKKHFSMFAP